LDSHHELSSLYTQVLLLLLLLLLLSFLLSNAERFDLYGIRKQKYQKWIIHRKLRVPMSTILSLQRYSTQR
jgi:hypothetical protein